MIPNVILGILVLLAGILLSAIFGWFLAKAFFKAETANPETLSPGETVMVSSDGKQWELRTYAYYQSGFYYCKILNHEHMMKAQPWAMCVKLEISAS